ncbi:MULTISPECIES: lytic murein transglycosylase B [unclassified Achromobacter]|uniref:lytic murein transglycosylase B n=1 Tax=unclassified Achromobacter TaxID=2626865 RepID=UPI000B51C34E|nr:MULTISPECIES: lytic murein transglycosylase B [unclassified Achromobacter]OWT70254.1 lytic murein transglycosylase B [Achromobacter sp. HZ34]OWT71794.1 lytic murein transglycosylase B [Achromobacter sp. HZ28]
MFTSRRFLQIALATTALAGCASTPPKAGPEVATGVPSNTSAAAADGEVARIRIGPPPAQGALASMDSEPGDEPSAVLSPTGQLRPEVQAYARQLAADRNLRVDAVVSALSGARYSETVARLIAPPPGKKISRSWITYRSRVVEPKTIGWGATFWQENQDTLDRAAQRFGVPASVIVAIIGVETRYGRNMGSFRVLDSLSTLAFDYPDPSKPERAQMFRDQLSDFLTLVMQGKLDLQTRGSYAGAIGMPQFMPGSVMRYAIDGDGTGHIDLANSANDAILSVGNFLMEHGWQRGLPVFAPVTLPADPSILVDGGLKPQRDWPTLQAAGATVRPVTAQAGYGTTWQQGPLGVVDLPEESAGTAEYRTATVNFFALTQYNHSYFYATSVADLAEAVRQRMNLVAGR